MHRAWLYLQAWKGVEAGVMQYTVMTGKLVDSINTPTGVRGAVKKDQSGGLWRWLCQEMIRTQTW